MFPSAQGGSEAAPQWDSLLELEGHSDMRVAPRVRRFRWDEIPAGRDTPSRRGFLQLGGRGRAAQRGPDSPGTAAARAFRRGPAGDAHARVHTHAAGSFEALLIQKRNMPLTPALYPLGLRPLVF